MTSRKILENHALIICTRNRVQRLMKLMDNLQECHALPGLVLLVDSSDVPLVDAELKEIQAKLGVRLGYIETESGLPFQRNVGMDSLARQDKAKRINICNFLDDDVSFDPAYFDTVAKVFSNLNPVALGAFDSVLPEPKTSTLRRLLGLSGRQSGTLLRSGIAVAPAVVKASRAVDWLPGHSVAYRWPLIQELGFASDIRMYGEDVELCLRLRAYGSLIIHPEVFVQHNPESTGRDAAVAIQAYSSGFRWRLANDHSYCVSKRAVFLATFSLLLGGLAASLLNRTSSAVWKGQAVFLLRLFRRAKVEQLIQRPQVSEVPDEIRNLREDLFVSNRRFSDGSSQAV